MRINKNKMQIALAKACMNPYDLCEKAEFSYQTYRRLMSNGKCKPATLGKIAKALNVDVTEIVEE
ncbi:MAG: helix-turn-helix transcriptional regulator [Lachnospiraceae bacterium]|nr:helix-turn-helix transcriptional regulator [Lachnospiraceae bacterium]